MPSSPVQDLAWNGHHVLALIHHAARQLPSVPIPHNQITAIIIPHIYVFFTFLLDRKTLCHGFQLVSECVPDLCVWLLPHHFSQSDFHVTHVLLFELSHQIGHLLKRHRFWHIRKINFWLVLYVFVPPPMGASMSDMEHQEKPVSSLSIVRESRYTHD